MKKIFYLSALLLLMSCERKPVIKKNSFIFQIPQKEIFVKTIQYPDDKFTVFFSKDSLSFNHCEDSIGFEARAYSEIYKWKDPNLLDMEDEGRQTLDYTQIYIDSADVIHVRGCATLRYIGSKNFKIEETDNDVFNFFFNNDIQKYPSPLIDIYTYAHHVLLNGQVIKQGNIYETWY